MGIARVAKEKRPRGFPGPFSFLFYETGFLECEVCTALLHCLKSLRGNTDGNLLTEFWKEECLCLEIDLTAALSCRVEFGSANTIGVASTHL